MAGAKIAALSHFLRCGSDLRHKIVTQELLAVCIELGLVILGQFVDQAHEARVFLLQPVNPAHESAAIMTTIQWLQGRARFLARGLGIQPISVPQDAIGWRPFLI